MLGNIGGWHALIIGAIVLLLFGATKLPALSKGLGQSINIFRRRSATPQRRARTPPPRTPPTPASLNPHTEEN